VEIIPPIHDSQRLTRTNSVAATIIR